MSGGQRITTLAARCITWRGYREWQLGSLGWTMLPQPDAQRHIVIRRGVPAIGAEAIAQELPTDRIAVRPEVLDRHVILGAKPPVAIAIEEHLAGHLRPVGAGGVPQTPIKEDRRAWWRQDRDRSARLPRAVAGRSSVSHR